MATIEKQEVRLRAILLQRVDDGTIEVRADYALVTSEGEISRSKSYEPTTAQWGIIKAFGMSVLKKVKESEGL